MRSFRLIPIAAILAACGCGAPHPHNEVDAASPAGALPALQETVRTAQRGELLPPGSVIGSDSPSGGVETIAFDNRSPPARLIAWYRGSDREFRIGSELQEGAEYVLAGTAGPAGRRFTVRLGPGRNGGTSGMILFFER